MTKREGMREYAAEDRADAKLAASIQPRVEKDPKDAKREAMLKYIRDTLIERAQAMRQCFELNPFLYCESPEGQDHLKRVVAIEAAADVFTHLVGEWQRTEDRPGWLRAITKQSMATFIGAFQ